MTAIVGGWALVTFEIAFSDGRPPVFPFGESPRGHLVYAASGMMSAVLSTSDRAPMGASRLETSDATPAAAKAKAFDSYLSYGGRYRVNGNEIQHHVDVALVPELVGTTLVRQFTIADDVLTVTYAITAKSGVRRDYTLTFHADTTSQA